MPEFKLLLGDCLEVMKDLPESSVSSIVTDPPYGFSFMGKEWDHGVPGVPFWEAALRVAKPGAHLLAFGGTRTFHRLTVAIEDAGWEIRDCLMWLQGQGFPKGHNQLKPAWEPIIMARKPLSESTVAANVLKWGAGGINIDACRIGTHTETHASKPRHERNGFVKGFVGGTETQHHDHGRWPANLILDEEAGVLLDEQSGVNQSSQSYRGERHGAIYGNGKGPSGPDGLRGYSDTGGASRFFYCAKASKKDRGDGNNHPTVKPTSLMRWLVRLSTPPGGAILDPFVGSGSTGKAAMMEGFDFVGIDTEEKYLDIARARIQSASMSMNVGFPQ